jgi:hypothetical protein
MRTRWVKVKINDSGCFVEKPTDMPENEALAILQTGGKMMSGLMQSELKRVLEG